MVEKKIVTRQETVLERAHSIRRHILFFRNGRYLDDSPAVRSQLFLF